MSAEASIDPTIGGRLGPLAPGYKRAFKCCNKCGCVATYDYVPYSLSSPILTMPCGHTKDGSRMDTRDIGEREAFEYFHARERKRK